VPKSETESPLIDAATQLDVELRRFEDLSLQIKKLPLNTEKNLERALLHDRRVGLLPFAHVRDRLHQRAHLLAEPLVAVGDLLQRLRRALELQARTEVYQELLKHFGTLGQEAGNINALVQDIAGQPRATPDERAKVIERLVEAQEKMTIVADGAKALADAATTQDFQDLARSADTLRQSLLAARNKINLLHKGLTS